MEDLMESRKASFVKLQKTESAILVKILPEIEKNCSYKLFYINIVCYPHSV